jgi:hypothetical protein
MYGQNYCLTSLNVSEPKDPVNATHVRRLLDMHAPFLEAVCSIESCASRFYMFPFPAVGQSTPLSFRYLCNKRGDIRGQEIGCLDFSAYPAIELRWDEHRFVGFIETSGHLDECPLYGLCPQESEIELIGNFRTFISRAAASVLDAVEKDFQEVEKLVKLDLRILLCHGEVILSCLRCFSSSCKMPREELIINDFFNKAYALEYLLHCYDDELYACSRHSDGDVVTANRNEIIDVDYINQFLKKHKELIRAMNKCAFRKRYGHINKQLLPMTMKICDESKCTSICVYAVSRQLLAKNGCYWKNSSVAEFVGLVALPDCGSQLDRCPIYEFTPGGACFFAASNFNDFMTSALMEYLDWISITAEIVDPQEGAAIQRAQAMLEDLHDFSYIDIVKSPWKCKKMRFQDVVILK